ncbi:TetR family transcriptional regulator [Azoarcus sp. TTM-91]|nr:TetR/AcrR family transcriptional regulator [Azoarcus sp. TTM-91]NMG36514.1 TetR family transcriptional regulator [Azoarcus sp. TTM-91]
MNAIRERKAAEPALANGQRPPRRPRRRMPESRRGELMDAAERLFLAKGVAATSVDDITTAAQVAKGTFYVYFPSRDALLAALQQRFVDGFCQRVDAALARRRTGDWNGRLRAWFATALDTLLDQLVLHDMLFHELGHDHRDLVHDNPVVTQLAALVSQGVAAGVWHAAEPRYIAIIMFHGMHGLADDLAAQAQSGNKAARKRLADTLFNTFSSAMRPLVP